MSNSLRTTKPIARGIPRFSIPGLLEVSSSTALSRSELSRYGVGRFSICIALQLGFFGADHVVFASDCPFDPEGGEMYIREGINSIFNVRPTPQDIHKVCCGNAQKLMQSK